MPVPFSRPALAIAAVLTIAGCSSYDNGRGYGTASIAYSDGDYYGWSGDYYYPGTGYYIYDRSGNRQRWDDSQRHYWETRRGNHHRSDNWSGYHDSDGHDYHRNNDRHDQHR